MKKLSIFLAIVAILAVSAFGDTYVRGHYRKNGTYVTPHYRSNPNGSRFDNYSTKGNVNPYTGKRGTQSPYKLEVRDEKVDFSTFAGRGMCFWG